MPIIRVNGIILLVPSLLTYDFYIRLGRIELHVALDRTIRYFRRYIASEDNSGILVDVIGGHLLSGSLARSNSLLKLIVILIKRR